MFVCKNKLKGEKKSFTRDTFIVVNFQGKPQKSQASHTKPNNTRHTDTHPHLYKYTKKKRCPAPISPEKKSSPPSPDLRNGFRYANHLTIPLFLSSSFSLLSARPLLCLPHTLRVPTPSKKKDPPFGPCSLILLFLLPTPKPQEEQSRSRQFPHSPPPNIAEKKTPGNSVSLPKRKKQENCLAASPTWLE